MNNLDLYQLIKNDIKKFIIFIFIISFILWLILGIFNIGIDDSDKSGFKRSGFKILTDYKTGCQYIYRNGGIFPRMDEDGFQICIDTKEDK